MLNLIEGPRQQVFSREAGSVEGPLDQTFLASRCVNQGTRRAIALFSTVLPNAPFEFGEECLVLDKRMAAPGCPFSLQLIVRITKIANF